MRDDDDDKTSFLEKKKKETQRMMPDEDDVETALPRAASSGRRAQLMAKQYGSTWYLGTESSSSRRGRPSDASSDAACCGHTTIPRVTTDDLDDDKWPSSTSSMTPASRRRKRRARWVVLVVVVFSGWAASSIVKKSLTETVDAELGPLTKSGFATVGPHFLRPSHTLWGEYALKPPYRTGAWWLNAVIDDGKDPIPALPYQILLDSAGAAISYSSRRRAASAMAQVDAFAADWLAAPSSSEDDDPGAALSATVFDFEKACCNGSFVAAADAVRAAFEDERRTDNNETSEAAAPERSRFLTSRTSHLGLVMRYPYGVTAVAVKGSPTVTFELDVGSSLFLAPGQASGGRLEVRETIEEDGRWDVRAADGSRWRFWASDGVRVDVVPEGVAATAQRQEPDGGPGILRVAHSWNATLKCPLTYAVGGEPVFKVRNDWSTYALDWTARAIDPTCNTLDLLALAHHADAIVDEGTNISRNASPFVAAKGPMRWATSKVATTPTETRDDKRLTGVARWTLRFSLLESEKKPPTTFARRDRLPGPKKRVVAKQARVDVRSLKSHPSVMARPGAYGQLYFEGKELARLARLALVSDAVDDRDNRNLAVLYLERRFDRLLRADDKFGVDSTWGGLVSLPLLSDASQGDPFANFGNQLYSDHHFHYGYYCYAAAVLASYRPLWYRAWSRRLRDMVKDYANPPPASSRDPGTTASDTSTTTTWLGFSLFGGGGASGGTKNNGVTSFVSSSSSTKSDHHGPPQSYSRLSSRDERFPVARHKDWYDGHSWATGLVSYVTGKSQESSSEAAHAYHAVALLGAAVGDDDLRDWGRLLAATEIVAAQTYWQLSPELYDADFAEANGITGSVAGSAAVAATWFGANFEYVHGINVLPVLPGLTDALFSSSFVCSQLPRLETALARPKPFEVEQSWRGVILANVALVDPRRAWKLAQDLDEDQFDDGNSKANLLHWIATTEFLVSSASSSSSSSSDDGMDDRADVVEGQGASSYVAAPQQDGVLTWRDPICPFRIPDRDDDDSAPDLGDLPYNKSKLTPACAANLACVAFGLSGECCPQPDGYVFGCCPVLVATGDTTTSDSSTEASDDAIQ